MSMIIDGTNGLTFNNATTQASAGCVLQVVQAVSTTQTLVSSNTYTDLTGFTATITPKFSTSKILIMFSLGCYAAGSSNGTGVQVLRGSTIIYTPGGGNATGPFMTYAGSTDMNVSQSNQYLDSPATTSATTYKLQGRPYNAGTGSARFLFSDTLNQTGTLTLLEVAA